MGEGGRGMGRDGALQEADMAVGAPTFTTFTMMLPPPLTSVQGEVAASSSHLSAGEAI